VLHKFDIRCDYCGGQVLEEVHWIGVAVSELLFNFQILWGVYIIIIGTGEIPAHAFVGLGGGWICLLCLDIAYYVSCNLYVSFAFLIVESKHSL
jgi:hypothetical protein